MTTMQIEQPITHEVIVSESIRDAMIVADDDAARLSRLYCCCFIESPLDAGNLQKHDELLQDELFVSESDASAWYRGEDAGFCFRPQSRWLVVTTLVSISPARERFCHT